MAAAKDSVSVGAEVGGGQAARLLLGYRRIRGHPRIIHRDIKSSNILLDNNFEAKVADFGLARLALDAVTHVTTRVMGTFGYMAPEYASSGKLTERSDVFSFGVVLLEIITGRRPVDASRPSGNESLVEWVVRVLDSLADIDLTNGVQPGQKRDFQCCQHRRDMAVPADGGWCKHDSSDLSQYGWSSHSRGTDAAPSSRIL